MRRAIDEFIEQLKNSPQGHVFNPWYEADEAHDIGPDAPGIRREQLSAYLLERTGKARYVLMGEAPGYQGGHFSGIAMTSERILLGHQRDKGIRPEDVFTTIEPRRTSRPEIRETGFSEPTATIAWGSLLGLGIDPRAFVIWNTFAWHPFDPKRGMLSNRRPTDDELAEGLPVLKAFLALFPEVMVIAVGKVAEKELNGLGIACAGVRHPANGGAGEFRRQIGEIVGKKVIDSRLTHCA